MSAVVESVQEHADQARANIQEAPVLKFDYSIFDEDTRAKVIEAVMLCKVEIRRTAEQLMRFGEAFSRLQMVAGMDFQVICQVEFPEISERTLYRYKALHDLCKKNPFLIEHTDNITVTAIYKLIDEDAVMDKVRGLLESGEKVDAKDAQKIVDEYLDVERSKNIELLEQVGGMRAELDEANSERAKLKAEAERYELRARQLEESLNKAMNSEKEASKEIGELCEEVSDLKANARRLELALVEKDKNPAVTVETKEVLPEGFTSLEDALADRRIKLEAAETALAAANDKLVAARREVEIADSQKRAIEANQEKVMTFVHDLENVLERYPVSLMAAIVAGDESIKPVLKRAASALRSLAGNIDSVVA